MIQSLLTLSDTIIAVAAFVALAIVLLAASVWGWAVRDAYKKSGQGDNPND